MDELRRARFGARSEKRCPEQYALPLEDVELAQGMLEAAQERADATLEASRPVPRPVKRNRGRLPAHLPRVERVIEPGSTSCPCGCGPMARIGEDGEPSRRHAFETDGERAPRRRARPVPGAGDPAPATRLPALLGRGRAGARARARRARRAAHRGVDRARRRLEVRRPPAVPPPGADLRPPRGGARPRDGSSAWAGRACFHLQPIVERMREHLGHAEQLFMDETTAPVLDPGRGRTKRGFLEGHRLGRPRPRRPRSAGRDLPHRPGPRGRLGRGLPGGLLRALRAMRRLRR